MQITINIIKEDDCDYYAVMNTPKGNLHTVGRTLTEILYNLESANFMKEVDMYSLTV